MNKLQYQFGNIEPWMGIPLCDLVMETTDEEVLNNTKNNIDEDFWYCACGVADLLKLLEIAGCLDSEV